MKPAAIAQAEHSEAPAFYLEARGVLAGVRHSVPARRHFHGHLVDARLAAS
jgi:hypothetical protein